jgi:hypothetical protein
LPLLAFFRACLFNIYACSLNYDAMQTILLF